MLERIHFKKGKVSRESVVEAGEPLMEAEDPS